MMSDHSRPFTLQVPNPAARGIYRLITATCPTELSLTKLLTPPRTVTLPVPKSPEVSVKAQGFWTKNHRMGKPWKLALLGKDQGVFHLWKWNFHGISTNQNLKFSCWPGLGPLLGGCLW